MFFIQNLVSHGGRFGLLSMYVVCNVKVSNHAKFCKTEPNVMIVLLWLGLNQEKLNDFWIWK